jgi:hypothetical protein
MAKVINLGSAKPDSPIYSGGVEGFSPKGPKGSSTDSPESTDGEGQETSPDSSGPTPA